MEETVLNFNIDLSAGLGQLQVRLQHIMDMVAIGLTGIEDSQQTELTMPGTMFQMKPGNNASLNIEDAKLQSKSWILMSAMRDFIEAVSAFLEEVRIACSSFAILKSISLGPTIVLTDDTTKLLNDWMQNVEAENKKFNRLGLPDKVERLKADYSTTIIPVSISDILSMNIARNCLVHRAGVVTDKDKNINNGLQVDWTKLEMLLDDKIIQPAQPAISGQKLGIRFVKTSKVFLLGERILFTTDEIGQICMACTFFARDCAEKTEAYWRTQGFEFSSPTENM